MTWSYDAIAAVYATDMGASMPFDDAAFYRDVCLRQGGNALEFGCGTGRALGTGLRAALSADAAGVLSTTSQHMHQGARRVRFIARWRPALAAAALLVITVGLWRMDSLRARFADDRSTAASDFRGAQGSFVVASHATSRMLMAAWTARARARGC